MLGAALLAACGGSPTVTPTPGAPPNGGDPPVIDDTRFDVVVDAIQVTQAVQTYAGTVPLVKDRGGLVRVFLRASQANAAAPAVRLRLVTTASGAVVRTWDLPAPAPGVPTAPSEARLDGSWNAALAPEDVQPGRHLQAEVDPAGALDQPRQNDTLRLPAAGSLDVRAVPTLAVTLVPVVQSGLTPHVVSATRTAASWLATSLRQHPLAAADVQVGATFTTSVVLTSDGATWGDLLSDLRTKRTADGSSRTYLGAVATSYSSGVAGIGYVGYPVALTWDRTSYQSTAAHELGHTFGRVHAPCGSVASADPSWPSGAAYADGRIGAWGWDPASGALVDPDQARDLMGYCTPKWVSDYTYAGVLGRLAPRASALALPAGPLPAREPCLVVAGRLRGGRADLEPAFLLDTLPALPPPGPYALELLGGGGEVIAAVPFAPDLAQAEVDGEADQHHFALALPLPPEWARDLAGLRVVERATGRVLPPRALPAPRRVPAAGAAAALAAAGPPGRAHLSWDASAHPRALVRDPRTGEVVALLRGGEGSFESDAAELEVVLSDGVRSERRLLRVR
jgi:hypothetical protein